MIRGSREIPFSAKWFRPLADPFTDTSVEFYVYTIRMRHVVPYTNHYPVITVSLSIKSNKSPHYSRGYLSYLRRRGLLDAALLQLRNVEIFQRDIYY